MYGRRGLGFPSPVVVVVVVVVVVIVVVFRWKWRQAVVRSEEVRRLLVSASEESSRVEFEAKEECYYGGNVNVAPVAGVSVSSYGSGRVGLPVKAVYQCAVCFRPTNTRCAKCKAVRYCSGKCQIVHWRQGHKEECRPYVAVTQINNARHSSNRQGDHKDHSDSFDTEAKQTATPAEPKSPLSYEGPFVFSTPTNFSTGVTFENLETVKSAHGIPLSPARKSTGLSDNNKKTSILSDEDNSSFWTDNGFNNQKTSILSDEDTRSGTSNSSFWTDEGSNESSLPSDVSSHHASTAARYSVVPGKSDVFCNTSTAPDMSKSSEVVSSSAKASDAYSTTVTSGSISHSTKPVKVVDDNHNIATCSSKLTEASKFRESKNSLSDVPSHRASTAERYSKVSEKSNDVSSSTKASDAYSTTVTGRSISHSTKPVKVVDDDNHNIATCSSQLTEASKFRESKNSLSDVPSHRASTAERYSKVSEKSNDVSSSTKASDAYSTTFTSGNISHSTKPVKVVDDDNHNIATCSSKLTEASKFRESKNSLSDIPSHRASTAERYSKVSEKSNDVFCNKSTTPDTSKSRDVVSSSPRASDTYLTTVTSRHTSHRTKPMKVVDNVGHSHRTTTSASQLAEASRSGTKTSKSKVVDYLKSSKLSRQESLEGLNNTSDNYSFKGLFPYEMFIKLYNWKHVELQPFGLKNCGNSCYANAVLQCLIYTPPLTAYLLEGLHSKACEKRGWCFTCEFESLVTKAKDGISPLSPIRMLTHIENVGSNLGHGKEEDAHEFLRYVIDALQSVCIKESKRKSLNSLEEETTLIGLTFGGYLRSKIMCMKCGGKSEQHERMMDLTVEIEGDVRTLEEALYMFTSTEILDGENKYKCNRCKSYEKAKKKFTLLEAPNVLTIALKRFQSGKFGKLNKSVRFPEILDMAPYVSGTSDKSPIYSLYGVVVHVDTMNAAFSGHYVSYVKNFQNRWFKFDDSIVKEVDLHHVLTKGAYMLLYARCSPRAPRSIRSSIIHHHHHHDPRKQKIPPSFVSKPHSIAPWETHSYHPPPVHHRSIEEESFSSDNSGFFSESCSCSTDSTHRDLSSIEDHISGDWEPDYHKNVNFNSSDSDTSSSSSFPSPLYSRLSQLYSSTANGEEDRKLSKVCRNLGCSCNSCRLTNCDRLGGRATYLPSRPSVTLRR
ncbi:putative ubiquitinyl hydrolase 1 [Helianthus debilis subsp. tardiflorus]